MKLTARTRRVITVLFGCLGVMGLVLFLRRGWADYMFFRAAFAFLDYEKAGALVVLENLLMLVFWAFIGGLGAVLSRSLSRKEQEK